MKTFLTSNYLSLMNAFKHHSDTRVDYLDPVYPKKTINLLKDYCTLRLDGGRQSGKTSAVNQFAADWLLNGGTVIVLSDTSSYAKVTAKSIEKQAKQYGYENSHYFLISNSIRSFVGNEAHQLRGRSLTRILYIIDEPMKASPDKIYEIHQKWVWPTQLSLQETIRQPLFFILGTQQ